MNSNTIFACGSTNDDPLAGFSVGYVPLVAALQSMYSLHEYPQDHYFWELLAFTAGTGGSCLIIGSAAGVAVMGIEKIDFFWYLKKMSWIALIGFTVGVATFLIQHFLVQNVL